MHTGSVKNNNKIVVITGATGSGKSDLAISVARSLFERKGQGCEIIAADSRTVYKGMDIGTAKPSMDERGGVPHWGFDLVRPDEHFSVKDFCEYAKKKTEEIQRRGNQVLIVGGTGLYIDALAYGYQFNDDVKKTCSDRAEFAGPYKIFALDWDRTELRKRLKKRINKMFNDERLEKETIGLVNKYGWESKAMTADVYRYVWAVHQGEMSKDEAMEKCEIDDWHLAKRQLTWFKRTSEIEWVKYDEAKERILACLGC
ncbi:hypothetical protein IKF15_02280 [Candidatus Saccharibacteria bacterium]|nr:hypothetical protein [Candidatus Saccharibacteria bacterium]